MKLYYITYIILCITKLIRPQNSSLYKNSVAHFYLPGIIEQRNVKQVLYYADFEE